MRKVTVNRQDQEINIKQRRERRAMILRIFAFVALILIGRNSFAQELPDFITENTSSFILKIDGLGKAEGELRIAMFNSKETYTKEPVFAVVIPADSTSLIWSVDELPFGEYAIAVYHDKNANGKLDTNFLGIPKERYGFSNNARGKFGPASWNDSNFTFSSDQKEHNISIK